LPGTGDLDESMRKVVLYRLDAIAYGVLIAWLVHRWRGRVMSLRWYGLAAGLLLVVLPRAGALPQTYAYQIAYTMIPVGCALSIPWFAGLRQPAAILVRPIRWLSTRSYAIYLVHGQLLVLLYSKWPYHVAPELRVLMALSASMLLADFSFRFIEQPFMRLRPAQFRGDRAASAVQVHGAG
jgi:peptidoglycan/LPS O-acetylase OafA/YrhL